MGLFAGCLFDLQIVGGLGDFPVKLIFGLAEFVQALTQSAGKLGEFLCPEQNENDQKYDQNLGHPGH